MSTLRSRLGHSPHRPPLRLVLISALAASLIGTVLPAGASAGLDPVAQDQQALLFQMNLARWDPAGFAATTGIDLGDTLPRPPVAVNPELTASAAFKADEIAQNEYFSHQSSVTGMWPNALARATGFPLPAEFPDDSNNIESLHSGSPVPYAVLGSFAGSPSHRHHVFGQGWFGTHLEVGIGRSDAANVWVVHTAYRNGSRVRLTGTVFDDLNGNGMMDPGEGLPGITVTVVGIGSVVTNGGGGYAIEVPDGKHRIRASGPGFAGVSRATVRINGYNVGADFTSGEPAPVVRDYQLCFGREPTILGTSGDDVIYGTDGDDVIHGLGGNDIIYGLGGNDVICGGMGNDYIDGGPGRDRIHGGPGDDMILGRGGNDILIGGGGWDVIRGGRGHDVCRTGERIFDCEG